MEKHHPRQQVDTRETLPERIREKGRKADYIDFIRSLAGPTSDKAILDIGCGNGETLISLLRGTQLGFVVGCDISSDLLESAEKRAKQEKMEITFFRHDANLPFLYGDGTFDIVLSIYSIYNLGNIEAVLMEIERLLRNEGRVTIVGPSSENCSELYELHRKEIGLSDDFLERANCTETEVIPGVSRHFRNVTIKRFSNEVHYETIDEFMNWYSRSQLFEMHKRSDKQGEENIRRIAAAVSQEIQRSGEYVRYLRTIGVAALK